ncbi:MAG TPA: peroxidase family protein, partial [Rubrobacteraceae bacterium]|nr:peroxidase family protein [Rubrobacteraceae bacterium]
QIHNLLGRTSESEVVSGIPGSPTNHFGVPYSMTEEFSAVYRMHPLIPDEYTFRSATSGKVLEERDESGEALRKLEKLRLADIAGERTFEFMKQVPKQADLFYSFGIAHPGEITLHNYPNSLREFRRPPKENERPEDVKLIDLAATDILRIRELGLPRYNEFRELLHLPPVRTFEELTDNPFWAEKIRRIYKDDIDLVDLMVGLYAEPRPEGFGFSDTAFRIFILMASRRLNSDRFFTSDYTPEIYTQVGLDWIDQNDMRTVLLRHFPDLTPALRNIKNTFFPWWRP